MKEKYKIISVIAATLILTGLGTAQQSNFYKQDGTVYCNGVSPGTTKTLDGVTYEVAGDKSDLEDMVDNSNAYKACTSQVTDMNSTFKFADS
ncbi:MAG: hypothetical protein H8Z69_00005, partial [Nanohaloarchaea archaeon]|nr:hypothetical protein [Candidatus Nanohaloarchaea archaeon]